MFHFYILDIAEGENILEQTKTREEERDMEITIL